MLFVLVGLAVALAVVKCLDKRARKDTANKPSSDNSIDKK